MSENTRTHTEIARKESGIKLKGLIAFLIKINSYSTKGQMKKLEIIYISGGKALNAILLTQI